MYYISSIRSKEYDVNVKQRKKEEEEEKVRASYTSEQYTRILIFIK